MEQFGVEVVAVDVITGKSWPFADRIKVVGLVVVVAVVGVPVFAPREVGVNWLVFMLDEDEAIADDDGDVSFGEIFGAIKHGVVLIFMPAPFILTKSPS